MYASELGLGLGLGLGLVVLGFLGSRGPRLVVLDGDGECCSSSIDYFIARILSYRVRLFNSWFVFSLFLSLSLFFSLFL
jgi:hypothetical protein